MPQVNLSEYKYGIVMDGADRNLDAIFRSERPNVNAVRVYAQQIAEALQHLHKDGKMIHGDVKLLNVVRFDNRLKLIDLDACSKLTSKVVKFYAGSKFSSGVLPPEMIYKVTSDEDLKLFEDHFSERDSDDDRELWEKVQPKSHGTGWDENHYVVKTFRTERKQLTVKGKEYDIEQPTADFATLPYRLVESTPSIDIWSFGTILYALLTGSPLFPVNRDDDLLNGAAMSEVEGWTDAKKSKKLEAVSDPLARDLLRDLLMASPTDRPKSIDEVLGE